MEPVNPVQAVDDPHAAFARTPQLPNVSRAGDDQQRVAVIARVVADLDPTLLQARGSLSRKETIPPTPCTLGTMLIRVISAAPSAPACGQGFRPDFILAGGLKQHRVCADDSPTPDGEYTLLAEHLRPAGENHIVLDHNALEETGPRGGGYPRGQA